jgi:carbon storage regulator
MLVLSRKAEEEIRIGTSVVVRVLRVSGSSVKLGIEAPLETPIVRGELRQEISGGEAELQINWNQPQ